MESECDKETDRSETKVHRERLDGHSSSSSKIPTARERRKRYIQKREEELKTSKESIIQKSSDENGDPNNDSNKEDNEEEVTDENTFQVVSNQPTPGKVPNNQQKQHKRQTRRTDNKIEDLDNTILRWANEEKELLKVKDGLLHNTVDFGDYSILMYETQDAFNHCRNLRLQLQISEQQVQLKTKQCNTLMEQRTQIKHEAQRQLKESNQHIHNLKEKLLKTEQKLVNLYGENEWLQGKYEEMKTLCVKYRDKYLDHNVNDVKDRQENINTDYEVIQPKEHLTDNVDEENIATGGVDSNDMDDINQTILASPVSRNSVNGPSTPSKKSRVEGPLHEHGNCKYNTFEKVLNIILLPKYIDILIYIYKHFSFCNVILSLIHI